MSDINRTTQPEKIEETIVKLIEISQGLKIIQKKQELKQRIYESDVRHRKKTRSSGWCSWTSC